MLKLGFRNFTLLVDGPIGLAALVVVTLTLVAGAVIYFHLVRS